jgi:hypothetical protein
MAFNPSTDTRVEVWCNASLESPLTSGTPVTTATDQKGNASFTQATSSKRPTLTQIGGNWYYSFDSVNDILRAGDLSALFPSGSATLVIRFKVTSAEFTVLYQTLSGGDDFTWLSADSYLSIFRSNRQTFSPGITETAGLHTLMVVSSSSTYEVFVDDVSIGTKTAAFAAGTDHNLGAYSAGGTDSRFCGVDVKEFLLLNGVPANSTDRTEIYDYTVTGINNPPVVGAGADQVLAAGSTSTSVTGTATDSDGTIASTAWTQVSGPNTATIVSASSLTTSLTGLITGTYVFRLTATDDLGATAHDDISIRINAAPVVNAGSDQTLSLGATTATITGSATDADGTIASHAWTQVSGPGTAGITSASSYSTGLTGLSAGSWVFRLTATDNDGAVVYDDMTITIPAPGPTPPAAPSNLIATVTTPNQINLSWTDNS